MPLRFLGEMFARMRRNRQITAQQKAKAVLEQARAKQTQQAAKPKRWEQVADSGEHRALAELVGKKKPQSAFQKQAGESKNAAQAKPANDVLEKTMATTVDPVEMQQIGKIQGFQSGTFLDACKGIGQKPEKVFPKVLKHFLNSEQLVWKSARRTYARYCLELEFKHANPENLIKAKRRLLERILGLAINKIKEAKKGKAK